MIGALRNQFSTSATGVKMEESPKKTVLEGNLPASWYTDSTFYEFERRAIFSKHWLLTTHRVRLPETGSYLRFEIAGFDFLLVKNKEGSIQAFHNVCRHRAYPLIDKDAPTEGKRSILSCGYYGKYYSSVNSKLSTTDPFPKGWSYNLNGNLTKAPKFEELPEFDRSEYDLFKIHTHVDKVGFVWINLDSSENPVAWEDLHGGTDEQPRLVDFSLDKYVYHRTWTTNGKYNWKVVGENYNEVCGVPVLRDYPVLT